MEIAEAGRVFKLVWIGFILITIYVFGWITFGLFTFGNLLNLDFTIWNLVIPNIFTFGILFVYSKELLYGYNPKSKSRNIKSLCIYSILILVLTLIQLPQFELLFSEFKLEYWQIFLSLIIILTSYIGILMNRILKINELNSE